jgi:hypothetical protein
MDLMLTNGFGITLADMKSQLVNLRPIQSKATMLNYATILRVSLENHVVFRDALTHWNVPYAYSFSPSTVGNCINNAFQITAHMS